MKDGDIGSAVRGLVISWLDWHDEVDRREKGFELADRVEGWRVVDGGQIDSGGAWGITDAGTGELLAQGVGRESFDAAWQDSWMHIDRIGKRRISWLSTQPATLGCLQVWWVS